MSFIFALKILFLMIVLYFSRALFVALIRTMPEVLKKFENDKGLVVFWGFFYLGAIIGISGLMIKFAFGLLM